MKLSSITIALSLTASMVGFAQAQSDDQGATSSPIVPHRPSTDGGPVTEKDVLRQDQPLRRINPAPEDGNILVRFGQYARVYFKHPIKAVKIGDEFSVKATPESDHIIQFFGLAPGRAAITVERTDGVEETWAVVTVIGEPHEVKMYVPTPVKGRKEGDNSLITVVNENSGDVHTADSKDQPDYRTILCNEVGCEPLPPPAK